VDGRFDLIVLHLVLVMRRLGQEQGQFVDLTQQLIETFCQDLDHNLREMGVGDLTVPKRVRAYVEALYGRSDAYQAALATRDRQACARALARNVYGQVDLGDGPLLLADYMARTAHTLDVVPAAALARGEVTFPDPETIPAVSYD
jgi:cytochrome b pre-mRNA-processing protein 3